MFDCIYRRVTMDERCSSCYGTTFSWEDHQHICTGCGLVASEHGFVKDTSGLNWCSNYEQFSKFHPATSRLRKSQAKGHTLGNRQLKLIAVQMGFTPPMTNETYSLFERVYKHPSFHNRRLNSKLILAASCAYIISRQYGWPVLLSDICCHAQCNKSALGQWNKKILETFEIEIRSVDMPELIRARCEKSHLSCMVRDAAIRIITLSRQVWIVEGRQPETIATAAIFIAWQSTEEPILRMRVTPVRFCKDWKFTWTKQTAILINEMKSTLRLLAFEIPWLLPNSVTDATVTIYVKDVLKYQSTLLADARRKAIAMLTDDETDSEDDDDEGQCNVYTTVNSAIDTASAPLSTSRDNYLEDCEATLPISNTLPPIEGLSYTRLPPISCGKTDTPNPSPAVLSGKVGDPTTGYIFASSNEFDNGLVHLALFVPHSQLTTTSSDIQLATNPNNHIVHNSSFGCCMSHDVCQTANELQNTCVTKANSNQPATQFACSTVHHRSTRSNTQVSEDIVKVVQSQKRCSRHADLFLPPCIKRVKKETNKYSNMLTNKTCNVSVDTHTNRNLDSPILDSNDISDTDLHLYIKTDQEIGDSQAN